MTGDFAITSVKVWDVTTTAGAEWRNIAGAPFAPYAVGFSPDGRAVFSSTDGGVVTVWDLGTGAAQRTIGHRGSTTDMAALAPSPDGDLLATISSGPVDVWDLATGEHRFAFEPRDFVLAFAWGPDSELLAIAEGDDTTMRVVVVDRSGAEIAVVSDQPGHYITSVSFSPDGSLLAATSRPARGDPEKWNAAVWSWRAGTVEQTIQTTSELVAFDRTGTRLATTRFAENVVQIWDVRTGTLASTLSGHAAPITGLVYSHDGSMLASTSIDGTARLWDSGTGEQLQVLRAGGSRLGRAVFSPDDSMLATVGEDDGVVRVWALDLDDLIEIAHDRLTRGLTDLECRQYLHLETCPSPETPA
jgi:WD40 repeat protein